MSLETRLLSGLGLLALLPVVAYLFARGELVVAFSVVNVLLIVGSVYLMFAPVDTGEANHGHATT
jgi:hypothetical protein